MKPEHSVLRQILDFVILREILSRQILELFTLQFDENFGAKMSIDF